MRGEMLWFDEEKGFGFIRTEEDERLLVTRDGFVPGAAPVGRCKGLAVQFEIADGVERSAVGVSMPVEAAPRRARLHGRSH